MFSLSSRSPFTPHIFFIKSHPTMFSTTLSYYNDGSFLSRARETGAQKKVAEINQAWTYCHLVKRTYSLSPTDYFFVIRNHASHSMATMRFVLPTPGKMKAITADVANPSVPLLLFLRDDLHMSLYNGIKRLILSYRQFNFSNCI